ncbi:MAG: N-acetylmuramoyl-L-alanine amidase [Actinomycetota bacterium]|nr:N-acetylmuramoyl-L-alanine amidase [Actinomycetota bacterium]
MRFRLALVLCLAVLAPAAPAHASLPLAGRIVAIDPGHQLGNARHSAEINRSVDAGGFSKPCNTTGTATNAGYPESTFAMSTANYLKARLEKLGAKVYLTRTTESYSLWGPCVDVRGRFGAKVHADLMVSIHGDGAPAQYRGFFVIRPALRKGWTDDIYTRSNTLGQYVRAGLDAAKLSRANDYGGDGLDTRGDLGTLNWSNVPVVMIEMGNMRNATDAARMSSPTWRNNAYAAGLSSGITRYLTR